MSFIGSCNRCGECCRNELIAAFMRNPDGTHCEFMDAAQNNLCLIQDHYNQTGRKYPKATKTQYAWWQSECVPYPDAADPAHCPPIHQLPESCAITYVE